MVIYRCKELKVLHTVSTVMKLIFQEVQRRNGQNVLRVRFPNEIVEYQKMWMVRIEAIGKELLGQNFPTSPIYKNSIRRLS